MEIPNTIPRWALMVEDCLGLPPANQAFATPPGEEMMDDFDLAQEYGGPEWSGEQADSSVAEVPLLLPVQEAAALEELANRHGLTTGQILRRLVRDFLLQAQDGPRR